MIVDLVSRALDIGVINHKRLNGGSVSKVYVCQLVNHRYVVAKVDTSPTPMLSVEARMLSFLGTHSNLPVPAILHVDPMLLIMPFVQGNSLLGPREQRHAAELLAECHNITAPFFGLVDEEQRQFDTLIGGLPQPNPPTPSWIEFFRDQRLMYMAAEAALSGQLPMEMLPRIEKLAGDLDKLLDEPERPSLIHGDMWTTNILSQDGRIVAFLDPGIYFAHAEIELAFSTLFSTFREAFFDRYNEIRPLRPGFFEVRRDIYNLYPLLVHARLFGGTYVQGIARTLKRFGY